MSELFIHVYLDEDIDVREATTCDYGQYDSGRNTGPDSLHLMLRLEEQPLLFTGITRQTRRCFKRLTGSVPTFQLSRYDRRQYKRYRHGSSA